MTDNPRGAMFRVLVPNQHSRVTYAELFFDLVFVYAITQISHTLLGRFTPLGAVQVTLLFLAVWWVWVYTTWITNWLNPELTPVRILLFLLMLGGLVLSTSIPTAFEGRGLWFAIAYAAMQVGRTCFLAGVDPAPADPGALECDPHSGLAVGIRGVLDCSAALRRDIPDWCCGAWRSRSNMSRRRCGSGFPAMVPQRSRNGRSKAATWPSAAPASSSSRSAKPSSSTARPSPI